MGIDDQSKQFWASQTASLHRVEDADFYQRKAEEHIELLNAEEKKADILDLGCGAGELLQYLLLRLNVTTGLDYSSPMLEEARRRLGPIPIDLRCEGVFEFLPGADHGVWMTTGALNQYLAIGDTRKMVGMFQSNGKARTFILFDTVDPIRYNLMPLGISYREKHAFGKLGGNAGFKNFVLRSLFSTRLALGAFERDSTKLRGAGMGYGFRPAFWLRLAADQGLNCEIVSSRFYEYRYHVILRKVSV